MNKEKNYQKSDHNKKQKLKIIYRFDQITDKITYYRQNRGLFYGRASLWKVFFCIFLNKTLQYLVLPFTKNYMMFIDNFPKKEITYWTLMQYMDRSCSP